MGRETRGGGVVVVVVVVDGGGHGSKDDRGAHISTGKWTGDPYGSQATCLVPGTFR